jgi:hypothetical protein
MCITEIWKQVIKYFYKFISHVMLYNANMVPQVV